MSDVVSMDTSGPDAPTIGTMTQLIANLQNQVDVQSRIQAAKELPTIANALGAERTRTELVPYLMGCLDDEDEVADVICDAIIGFGKCIGGPDYIHVLLPPLEGIASGEEAATRVKAISGIATLAAQMQPVQIIKYVFPIIGRLAAGHWYTQRSSACGLFPLVYAIADAEIKTKILEWLSTLSGDQVL